MSDGYLTCRTCGGTSFNGLSSEERRAMLGRITTVFTGYCRKCGTKAQATRPGPASAHRYI